jgi:hypothetical protein
MPVPCVPAVPGAHLSVRWGVRQGGSVACVIRKLMNKHYLSIILGTLEFSGSFLRLG